MTPKTEDIFSTIKSSAIQGLIKGWNGYLWLLKIILPISFVTTLLVHFGLIYKLDFILTPIMTWLSLPASAALVLIIGLFTGIYGTVAALAVIPFSSEHMILIAVFTLISHNLIQESIVQGKSGVNPFFAAFFRLLMAFIVTFACAKLLAVTSGTGMSSVDYSFAEQAIPFDTMLSKWGIATFKLVIQIFCIIMPLMVILNWAKTFNAIRFITRLISPVLSLMGIDRSTGMLWLTASIFGLAYGSAVIVEETETNEFTKEELTKLHLSIGVNHAMIEDPALFLPLGLPALWLWVPRLVAAMLSTWLYTIFSSVRRLYVKRAHYKKLCNNR